jgi:hypothetical protein
VQGDYKVDCTCLWDPIFCGSNEALVLAPSIAMQVRRELRLNSLSRLDRDNYVAGQVCNSCHYSEAIGVSTVARRRLGARRGAEAERQGSRENERQTYRPLQACESSMMPSPCCQSGSCPSAGSKGREISRSRPDGGRERP